MTNNSRDLDEAILRGMSTGPMSEAYDTIRAYVKEYLADKFMVAMLKTKNVDEVKLINELWREIRGEEL